MKYKINREKILEVLEPYERGLFFDEYNCLHSHFDKDFIFIVDDTIVGDIKNKEFDSFSHMLYNLIIDKLNQHFNECFEEIKPKYSYDKCEKFLEDLGFKFYDDFIMYEVANKSMTSFTDDTFEKIIDHLNDEEDCSSLSNVGDFIYTLLKNNKDKLLED